MFFLFTVMLKFAVAITPIPESLVVHLGPDKNLMFSPNASVLTEKSKSQIKDLVQQARLQGKIGVIEIAAWSDQPSPKEDEKMVAKDIALAEKRSRIIQVFLKEVYQLKNVLSFNMAKRETWLVRAIDHSEIEKPKPDGKVVKDIQLSEEELQIFREKGAPSHAIVLVILK